MNTILSIIGSIASIGSIPLAIYLYLRSREVNAEKARREIIKILSYQLGEERKIDTFEISAVINAKTREFKVNNNIITSKQIIEELISDSIASPLLDKTRKDEIINNLQKIYINKKIETMVSSIDYSNEIEIDESLEQIKAVIIETNSNKIDTHVKDIYAYTNRSIRFAILATGLTIITLFFIFFGKSWIENLFESTLTKEMIILVNVLLGGVISLFAGFFTGRLKVRLEKIKEKTINVK